jgi:hypothetical protein
VGLSLAPADEPAGELSADCSHTAFNEFRFQIAAAEGIDLGAMDGYGGARGWEEIVSPLVPLLDHSDAEGDLSATACAQIIPRLTEIVDEWHMSDPAPADPASPRPRLHVPYGGTLIATMQACVDRQVPLRFN